MNSSTIPGPSRWELLTTWTRIRRNPLEAIGEWRERFGRTVRLPATGGGLYLLFDPRDVGHILVSNSARYKKQGNLIVARDVLGEGLVTSNGSLHRQQRRIFQPFFSLKRWGSLSSVVREVAMEETRHWRDGDVVNLAHAMSRITLIITGQVLLNVNLACQADLLIRSYFVAQRYMQAGVFSPCPALFRWPHHTSYQHAVRHIREFARDVIEERRNVHTPPDDLLTLLLQSRDTDGKSLPDKLIQDEIITFLAAGHETTANGLSWLLWVLGRTSGAKEKYINACHDKDPKALDAIFLEGLRLYPPIWAIGRDVVTEDRLPSGLDLRPGDHVVLVTQVIHRDPAWFPDPLVFRPERFTPGSEPSWPSFAFIPFGAGPRTCVGEAFAMSEARAILSFLAEFFDFTIQDYPRPEPELLITLRPRHGVWAKIRRL